MGFEGGREADKKLLSDPGPPHRSVNLSLLRAFKNVFVHLSFRPPVPDHRTFTMNTYTPGNSPLRSWSYQWQERYKTSPQPGKKGGQAAGQAGAALHGCLAATTRAARGPRVGLVAAAPTQAPLRSPCSHRRAAPTGGV